MAFLVHVGESACRYRNGMEWSCWLLVDLSTLALLAVSALGCHVFAHTLPDKTCSLFMFFQCCGSGIRCFFDPGIRLRIRDGKKFRIRDELPRSLSKSLETVILG